MRFVLTMMFSVCALFAAALKEVKIDLSGENLILLLTFDAPYAGKVQQRYEGDRLILSLESLSVDSPRLYSPKSDLIASIRINSSEGGAVVVFSQKVKVLARAELAPGGYSMAIRIDADPAASAIPPIGIGGLSGSYVYMILFVSAFLLFWIIFMLLKNKNRSFAKGGGVRLLWQKPIDAKNKIVRVEIDSTEYTLLIGAGSLLIDKTERKGAPPDNSESEFSNLMKIKGVRLSELLSEKPKKRQ
ncbi:MAG: hypothetical protein LBE89_05550 [Helicobacteraceae bacterium]|jgi:hypothetical protein|nr:hypothetical protein [Helicobacteraceae bacterium]